MNALTDQPIGWLLTLVVIWTVAVMFILLALAVFVPPLWTAGRAQMRRWLAPPCEIVDFTERRRASLRRAMGGR